MTPINWARLARALDFYEGKGFRRIELPWHAPAEICKLTHTGPSYPFNNDYLVGSAEQSFMHAQNTGSLPEGKYVALTPCFRREPVNSKTHLDCFMKVELYSPNNQNSDMAIYFAKTAKEFMQSETGNLIKLIPTDEGHDLEINNIEVGSYMSRTGGGMSWSCGTGIAEPRFSVAII